MTFAAIGILLASSLFQSCTNDDYEGQYYYPNALVTVKNADDKGIYLQLDGKTTLYPENLTSSPFGGKEVRALVNFKETDGDSKGYTKAVHINWMDSIRTKSTVPSVSAKSDLKYGSDPLEIMRDWVTIVEDGYMTLRLSTVWGGPGRIHYINLLTGVNPENPYEVTLRHDAKGDTFGQRGDALIAFSLKSLPDTEGKTVKLKINWMSFSGPKSAEFDYCTSGETGNAARSFTDSDFGGIFR